MRKILTLQNEDAEQLFSYLLAYKNMISKAEPFDAPIEEDSVTLGVLPMPDAEIQVPAKRFRH